MGSRKSNGNANKQEFLRIVSKVQKRIRGKKRQKKRKK